MRKIPLALALALLATLVARARASPHLAVTLVEVGSTVGGAFAPRPDRVFEAGEAVIVRAAVSLHPSSPSALTAEARLIHPLGATISTGRGWAQLGGATELFFLFTFQTSPLLPCGYYRVEVSAEACGERAEEWTVLYCSGAVSLENYVELEYELVVRGSGKVEELRLAMPNDPTLKLRVGPLAIPNPHRVVADKFGNMYAVYEGLKVDGELRVSIHAAAVQRLTYVNADAPLSAPLPKGLAEFLKPSPYIESDDPSIASLARELVEGARTYREALVRIADWVSSNIAYDERVSELPNYGELGALWALSARRGACLQFSRLFAALARAAGIPARLVEGFDVLSLGVEGGRLTHAFAEVYIPGYGWLPVEPQRGGSWLGFVPPAPGYVVVVRGAGEQVEDAGKSSLYVLRYRDSLSARFRYRARIAPAGPPPAKLELSLQLPPAAQYGDRLLLRPLARPEADCEVRVSSPSRSTLLRLPPGGGAEVELNETGTWLVEAFAWKSGYFPAYARASVEVTPRPLSLSVKVEDAYLFKQPRIVVRVSPPVEGLLVRLTAASCYSVERYTLVTDERGIAEVRLEPQLLPCQLRALASVAHPGYRAEPAEAETWPLPPPELAAAAAAMVALAIIAKRKRQALSYTSRPEGRANTVGGRDLSDVLRGAG